MSVAIIGAGISGTACAWALLERGVEVEIFDRGRTPGGRLASPRVHDRRVDVGAAYFTAKEPDFLVAVENWTLRGTVRAWTDTLDVYSPDGHDRTSGPIRYAAPGGLRTLVSDTLPVDIRSHHTVETLDDLDHEAVVLAMPDPQAARLAPDAFDWIDYEPVIAVAAGWPQRRWPVENAAFVNDDPDLTLVADDGSRRGDGAPVLVAHTTADRARAHLDNPDDAVAPVLAALRRVLGVDAEPDWTHVHRWTFAKPSGTHGDSAFGLTALSGRPLGACGDAWCPSGAPRVESAYLSGQRLGAELADHIAALG